MYLLSIVQKAACWLVKQPQAVLLLPTALRTDPASSRAAQATSLCSARWVILMTDPVTVCTCHLHLLVW